MKFYSYILAMKKETFFILAAMILWIWMVLRTFFGWSEEKPEIKDDSAWFIEQVTETWNIEWVSEPLVNINEPTENEYVEIRVMMPRYFYSAWWKNFAQDLYKEKNVYMNFTFIDNLNDYRDNISDASFSGADLALIPYDWIEYVETRPFSFQKNIDTDFDNLVSPIMGSTEISFLPFAVDPMIMYTLSGNEIQNNFAGLLDFVYNWVPNKNLAFPLFFWVTAEDYDEEWFIREYQDIVRYALMHYFTTYRDVNSLEKRLEANVLENYNINNLNTIIKAIPDQNCDNFPSICIQLYKLVAIRFWFLSDNDVVNQYFSWRKAIFDETLKSPTLMYSIESPFRLWGWIIPWTNQDVDKINGVYLFLAQYMKKHTSYSLWNSTLSAFSWSNSDLINNEFIWLRGYLLQWWWNFLGIMRNTRPFRQMIEYQISARDYLRL